MRRILSPLSSLLPLLVLAAPGEAYQLQVAGTSPGLNQGNIAPNTAVEVTFDQPVHRSTVPPAAANVHVGGMFSGSAAGTYSLVDGDTTLRFVPDEPFLPGEVVGVVVSRAVRAADGTPLRDEGYSFRFRIAAGPATMSFQRVQTLELRDVPQTSVRIYGGAPCDLDEDGWVDLAVVNEDSSDVRVLLSKADGTPRFDDFLTPVHPTGTRPSPNEPADFNGDGHVDLCTANVVGDSMSVLLGNGDGTFQPATNYPAGSTPKGIAVLDLEGDGDMDIVVANLSSSNLCSYVNDGNGSFTGPTFFEAGAAGEHGLAAADMNEDGISDLVVGALSSQRILVLLGNGDGTFTQSASLATGGSTWMLVCGDVNGDGHVDVTTANGPSGSATVVQGDGLGGLGTPVTVPAGSFTTATDLGDLDGDGDLDWMISDFGSGTWSLMENDGAGGFTLNQQFFADNNCACAAMVDTDRDGDLDLILFDEIADVIFIEENVSIPGSDAVAFCFGDGSASACPCGNDSPTAGEGCVHSGGTGMTISAGGTSSVTADDLFVSAANCPLGNTGLFYAGTVALTGAPLYDGLQCVAGSVRRFQGVFQEDGTVSDTGFVAQDPSGVYFTPGTTYHFQYWSRDVAAGTSTCAQQANFSPGLAVLASP